MPTSSSFRHARPAARPDRVQRRARAAGLIALTLATAIACRRGRDVANEARERQEQEVDRLAEQAGRMAAGESTPGARTARSDTGMRIALGGGSGAELTRSSDPALGPGDVRVTSSDGMMVLALIGDTVRTRLGDSAVAKMRREMNVEADTATGFGGFMAQTIKGAVAGGMAAATRFAVRIPVSEVREMRYENGELHLRSGKKNNMNARFAEADAERFMAAVRARQARPAGR